MSLKVSLSVIKFLFSNLTLLLRCKWWPNFKTNKLSIFFCLAFYFLTREIAWQALENIQPKHNNSLLLLTAKTVICVCDSELSGISHIALASCAETNWYPLQPWAATHKKCSRERERIEREWKRRESDRKSEGGRKKLHGHYWGKTGVNHLMVNESSERAKDNVLDNIKSLLEWERIKEKEREVNKER